MRYSKRTNYPDWDEKQSWDHRTGSSHHKRKQSYSSVHESKRCKYNNQIYDTLYSDASSFHEADQHERRYVEEYRSNYSQLSDTRHRCRDYESGYHNHSSKSSGRSGRSSYKRKHKSHHGKSHHHSHTVITAVKADGVDHLQ